MIENPKPIKSVYGVNMVMASFALQKTQTATSVISKVVDAFSSHKSLNELIKSLRNNRKDESGIISQCIMEIRQELASDDKRAKVRAIQKLTYLQMKGYDISWAAFSIIELITQGKFIPKRVGYLAASQSFSEKIDSVILITSLLRKEMTNSSLYESGIALNCLSNICTPELARDLAPDVIQMLLTSRPYIRKRAVLVLYKIFLNYPESLRASFNHLKEKLSDPDVAVASAAVNVICELAYLNPKNYIILAPILFDLLNNSSNNWMLIKVIKFFGSLIPHEPRLIKKLIEPLTLMLETSSMSLLHEVIQCLIIGFSQNESLMDLCLNKLRNLIQSQDRNLKYLGLTSILRIMKTYPRGVAQYRDLIFNFLEDDDIGIRMKALDLLMGMVNKKSLEPLVSRLLKYHQLIEGNYKDDFLAKIIFICSQQNYKFITDFEWYISVLIDLSHTIGSRKGSLVKDQLLDICTRVEVVRPFAVEQMVRVLNDIEDFFDNFDENNMCEVLGAAAWIAGEYAPLYKDYYEILDSLTKPRVIYLPASIQIIYLQNILKIFIIIINSPNFDQIETQVYTKILDQFLPDFIISSNLEVQERACFLESFVKFYKSCKSPSLAEEMASLLDEPIRPVALATQSKVPIPEGLDLEKWINEPESNESSVPSIPEWNNYLYNISNTQNTKSRNSEFEDFKGNGAGNPELLPLESPRDSSKGTARNCENNPGYLKPESFNEESDPRDLGSGKYKESSKINGRRCALQELMLKRNQESKTSKGTKKKSEKIKVLADEDLPNLQEVNKNVENIGNSHNNDKKLGNISPCDQSKSCNRVSQVPENSPNHAVSCNIGQELSSINELEINPSKNGYDKSKSIVKKTKKLKEKHKSSNEKDNRKKQITYGQRLLYRDDGILVTYTHSIPEASSSEFEIITNLTFKNLGTFPIISIDLDFQESTSIYSLIFKRPYPGTQHLEFIVEPRKSEIYQVYWNVRDCTNYCQIPVLLSYSQQKSNDDGIAKIVNPENLSLVVPCSSYLRPEKIELQQIVKLLKTSLLNNLSTVKLDGKVPDLINFLLNNLKLTLIEEKSDRGSMYGKTLLNHDVVISISLIDEKQLVLGIRSTNNNLTHSLIKEIVAVWNYVSKLK